MIRRRARQPSICRRPVIFVELSGASGATYRFRPWADAGQAPNGGNFAVVERADGKIAVHLIGVTNDLSKARAYVLDAGLSDEDLFIRLNVARAARRLEYDDLVAHYEPRHALDADT